MKKLFVSALVVLLLLISATSIGLAAFPCTEPNGTFITTSTTIHSITEEKFNKVVDLSSTLTYTGMLEGTSLLQGTLVIHRDGSASFRGVETFTGLVNGVPGTLTLTLDGGNDTSRVIELAAVISTTTGELANLRGVVWKVGSPDEEGPAGTYTVLLNDLSSAEK